MLDFFLGLLLGDVALIVWFVRGEVSTPLAVGYGLNILLRLIGAAVLILALCCA